MTGQPDVRQPVHTVYGGAHLFRADSAQKLGGVALRFIDEYAPDHAAFGRALRLKGWESLPTAVPEVERQREELERDPEGYRELNPAAWFSHTILGRVREKLEREPVEDYRIDFEDGFGPRPKREEDDTAESAAVEVARGLADGTLPPFIGIRIKPLTGDGGGRGLRTLELFLGRLAERTGGALPDGFVVTLPKVASAEEVSALASALESLEATLSLGDGALKLEIMVETPQAILGADGRTPLAGMVAAGRGRCVAAHFGVYDFTASCSVTAEYQLMQHPVCDFARQVMLVSLAGTGVMLSDGATNVLPVAGTREGVLRASRLHFRDVRHSLENAFYQGWDLHPAQLVTRYAAVHSFFLESLDSAADRLKHFVEQAALATLLGNVFDDAATGQGLLNFFLRGLSCGALTEEETLRSGLTLEELRSRSFVSILEGRRS